MDRRRLLLTAINIAGGIGVLGSYAAGFAAHPDDVGRVWGGVPESLKPLYTVSMLLAAAGYFPFTYLVIFRLDAERLRLPGGFDYSAFAWLYALVLLPSALWMPLTFAMLASPSGALWLAIRAALLAVGVGSVGILAALLSCEPRPRGVLFSAAIAGSIAFCAQTALLDALVWPAFF